MLALLKERCAPAAGRGSEVTAALDHVDVTVAGRVCVLTAEKAGGHNRRPVREFRFFLT